MKRLLLVLAAGLVLGSSATAAVGWRVFATATDNGEYGTYASASAKVVKPKALAVRAIGPTTSVTWFLSCDGESKGAALSGKAIIANVGTAKSCSLSGSAIGPGGTLRVQLLRK